MTGHSATLYVDVDAFPSWYCEPPEDDPWGDDGGEHVSVADTCGVPESRSITLVRYTPRPGQVSALAAILLGAHYGSDGNVD